MKKNLYALTVLGRDRAGIISAVAGRLAGLRVNIEDSSMTRLRNEFAMILLVSAPPRSEDRLLGGLRRLLPDIGFELRRLNPSESKRQPEPARVFSLKIYGADKVGIVAAVASSLASAKINIIDMRTRLLDSSGHKKKRGVYILSLDAVAPPRIGKKVFERIVGAAARRLGVCASVEEYEPSEL